MIGKEINIVPGSVISYSELDKIRDRDEMTEHLKYLTYKLGDSLNE